MITKLQPWKDFETRAIDDQRVEAKLNQYRESIESLGENEQVLDVLLLSLARQELVAEQLFAELGKLRAVVAAQNFVMNDESASQFVMGLRDSLEIKASHPLQRADGFYGLEKTGAGLSFRWTGPDTRFQFSLPINRSEVRKLELHILDSLQVDDLKELQCYADGFLVESELVRSGDSYVFKATLDARDVATQTSLVFQLPRALSPAEISTDSDDDRPLGLAFHKLVIA